MGAYLAKIKRTNLLVGVTGFSRRDSFGGTCDFPDFIGTLYLPFFQTTFRIIPNFFVGETGFEPATSWSQTKRSSRAELLPAHFKKMIFKIGFQKYVIEAEMSILSTIFGSFELFISLHKKTAHVFSRISHKTIY